ncbi:MAG: class I tRNA ligase family protein, partial [Candidatus Binatia bacterium]
KLSLGETLGDNPLKTQRVLMTVLKQVLLLLHPLMPFVTEEIWRTITSEGQNGISVTSERESSIMLQPYPKVDEKWIQPEAEEKVGFLTEVIRAIRNLRTEMNCPPSREIEVVLFAPENDIAFIRSQEPYLRTLARAGSMKYITQGERPKRAATAVVGTTEIYLPLTDMPNLREEEMRLTKEVGKVEMELARSQKKLSNQDFLSKAKEEVIEKERKKAEQLEDKIQTLNRSLKKIHDLQVEAGT